jgi:DmsE family decaheme c-type cytochrome
LAALRAYAQQIGLNQPRPASTREAGNADLDLDDADLSALRKYAQLNSPGAKSPPSPKAAAPKAAAPKRESAGANANYLGGKACLSCHASQTELYNRTQMGRLKLDCETCHGPGAAHVQAVSSKAAPPVGGRSLGGIISFRKNDPGRTAAENNQLCLGCHDKGNRVMWQASTHETRGLACTDCHTVMKDVSRKAGLRTAFEPDTCAQCHKNKRAEIWRTSHMPVREGKMTCGSCHNPHGTPNESLLKQATVNDNCYQCHAEKRGPFLFEHAPVRENCLNCHNAHGSVNDFMLKVSRPRACQQCHGTASGHPGNPRNPQSVYGLNRECQNCHSQVHGSNSPSGSRLMR